MRRGRITGTDLLPGLARATPLDVFGIGVDGLTEHLGCDRVRAVGDLPQHRMHAELARRAAYVHTARWTSLGLSLIEAMLLGMPVAVLATTESVEVVPPTAGVLTTDPERLRDGLRTLVEDRAAATAAGRVARAAALERFGVPVSSPTGTPCSTGPSSDCPFPPHRAARRARRARREGADPVRIAMVSEHASPLAAPGSPDAGGQNVHVSELSRALAAAGHEVTVLTRRDDPGLPELVPLHPGVVVRHVDAGPARPIPKDDLVPHLPALADGLERAWRAEPPDVVHAHFWMSGLAATAALGDQDIPFVQTFHALGSVKRRHQRGADTSPPGRVGAERALARRADRVLATCDDELFELIRMGADRRRVSVVPCGVDARAFSPDGPIAERSGRPRVVSVGRLVRRKGVDEVVAAMARVPEAELVVAGGAGEGDPDLARLQDLAVRCHVADRVRFLGPVARAEVPALLRSADAVVCAPWYEPFGIVALEAMACGRAVVATAVGGMQDTVVHGVTGLHVPPRRADVLGAALRGLVGNPTWPYAFGVAGRDRVLARYTWERVAAATERVYHDVLCERTPVARAVGGGQ